MRSLLLLAPAFLLAQQPVPRDQRGAPLVNVTHTGSTWTIAGQKNRVTFNERDFAIAVQTPVTTWKMTPSLADDMRVKSHGQEFDLRLTDAARIHVEPYDTGFKTGIKISLDQFRHSTPLDLRLYLTVALQGGDEDLVFDSAAAEGETVLRRLDWPKQMDTSDPIDFTVLSNRWGTLLPRNWPKEYNPIREGDPKDVSVVESNLIECWSMSWWGFQKGPAAMMIVIETPDDAAYKFSHPAGGPTVIGPRWRETLGRFGYPRTARMIFLGRGNYVTMAKRYRRYVMETGQFVSLKDKIAHDPRVADLIGTPHIRLHTFTNYRPGGYRYDAAHPERNVSLVTFDQRADQLRKLKERGIDRLYVCLAGWPYRGYDRQHPDELPPSPEAGGWDGLKRFNDAMNSLHYVWALHDQYRDFYTDSPSYQEQFAVHDEDTAPPLRFPGTRFGQTKTGVIPGMDHWDGGAMSYLSPRMQLGHVKKNYALIFAHGIHPTGVYFDVFGYIPPDEDFNPEHPSTRADSMRARALCMRWARQNIGLVGTEAASDWVIPYADFGSANPGQGLAIPVPLYQLVYHDAIVVPQDMGSTKARLVSLLYGGTPQIPVRGDDISDEALAFAKRAAALHARVGLLEMTNHEFLDANDRKERTTFADGTTVTADFDAGTVEVRPELSASSGAGSAAAGRASWMQQAKFGVMTHYLSDWQARVNHLTMSVEQWNKMVDGFDVEKMAEQLYSAGAAYYQISIGQNSGYYIAPNATYDKLVGIQPSHCSRRDLVADLYEALHKRGIKLMVYLPSGAPGQDKTADAALDWHNGPEPNKEFQSKWEQVIREWSLRWGRKVDGWWFDGCYWPNTMYRSKESPNFASFAAAARAGNPDAAVAFNPGVVYRMLSITPYEDFTAGEIDKPDQVMLRRTADGKIDGAQIQMLSYLGQTWGMGDPRFTTAQVIAFSKKLWAAGGAVTWDVPVALDGTIAKPFLDQLKDLSNAR